MLLTIEGQSRICHAAISLGEGQFISKAAETPLLLVSGLEPMIALWGGSPAFQLIEYRNP